MALDPNTRVRERLERPAARIGIVVSRYHEELTGAMLDSAQRELELAGVEAKNHFVVWVPGAFELPLVARALARRVDIDAVLCLGLILKGETDHDRYVAQGVVQGVVQAGLEADTPILFGVLTCSTIEQARSRALPAERGGRHDKGREVARAAIETLAALDRVEELQ
jgi:6,7-dimethyl-8-ribityllumazine synthase